MSNSKNLLLLFERPREPVFMPKGVQEAAFDVPMSYMTERFRSLKSQVATRFADHIKQHIPVKLAPVPPLDEIVKLKRDENFSLFIGEHRRLAGRLIDIFTGDDFSRTIDDLLSTAVYARERVNPYLFNYALSVALLHREDTQHLDIPTMVNFFPDKFIESDVFEKIREEAAIVPVGSRKFIEIPKNYTASDSVEEHRVAYFREDIGLNLHHWHWHLVYPAGGARRIVDKDRRGELFYYMHQQLVARYNFERLCNKLRRVERLHNWTEPVKEPYFPKLHSSVTSRPWPARVANQKLQDVNRVLDNIVVDVNDLTRWSNRIFDAIQSGTVKDGEGRDVALTEDKGIDILGNIVEASILSRNREFYGDLHNSGHLVVAYVHDPDHRYLEGNGVMGDTATAVRDPVFFRWHAFIDDIFQHFKHTLPKYNDDQLNYPGVTVQHVQVQSDGASPANVLHTFWQQSDLDLSRGMDFQSRGPVYVRFTHLQHTKFTYSIKVRSDAERQGTCRIFLAPKFDEKNSPWLFKEQKNMFIELDKFKVDLEEGENTIARRSTDSSVAIPFERTYRNLDTSKPVGEDALARFNFCGCGLPQNLLIPKGNPEGFPCQLFVMISNIADDAVDQDIVGECNDAYSYCGIKDKLYPDRRAMGYPFDRMPGPGVKTLQDFLTPNMWVANVSIVFKNKTDAPKNFQDA